MGDRLDVNRSTADHICPGCENCESAGQQCDDCDADDRSGQASCAPAWVRWRDLEARVEGSYHGGWCRADGYEYKPEHQESAS